MSILRPRKLLFLKALLIACGFLAAMYQYSKLNSTDENNRIIDAVLIKTQRQIVKYPNEAYSVIPNLIVPSQNTASEDSNPYIIICTQTSLNNLYKVINLSQAWDGHISVAVFSFDSEITQVLYYILLMRKCLKNIRNKVSFHLVYPISRPPTNLTSIFKMDFDCQALPLLRLNQATENYAIGNILYPVNVLRNVALHQSTSDYILNLDVDFVTSKGMKGDMEMFLTRQSKPQKIAYVIPCFESKVPIYHPLSKTELLDFVKNGSMRQFTVNKCSICHVKTNYTRWLNLPYPSRMNASYEIEFKMPYEPFYIADRQQFPLFDPMFKQYGFNRISQVCEAFFSGYDFVVMNNAFVIHDGFKDPKNFHVWKLNENNQNYVLFQTKFQPYLRQAYPNSTRHC